MPVQKKDLPVNPGQTRARVLVNRPLRALVAKGNRSSMQSLGAGSVVELVVEHTHQDYRLLNDMIAAGDLTLATKEDPVDVPVNPPPPAAAKKTGGGGSGGRGGGSAMSQAAPQPAAPQNQQAPEHQPAAQDQAGGGDLV